jgi:hypothetical protein
MSAEMNNQNFIKRHWNGEISLPIAYWGILTILAVAAADRYTYPSLKLLKRL